MHLRVLITVVACICCFIVPAQTISWYKQFNGAIDKFAVTMHLYKTGDRYSGFYYYLKTGHPITLMSIDDTLTLSGKIKLMAFVPGDIHSDEIFTVMVSGNTCRGEWRKGAAGSALPVTLVENALSPLSFKYIYEAASLQLNPALPQSAQATFSAATVWPKENTVSGMFIKKVIAEIFDKKSGDEEIEALLLHQKESFLKNYREENKNVSDSDMISSPSAYMLETDHQVHVMYQSDRLLTLANFNYTYTGGAHGNYSTSYLVLNVDDNKRLLLGDIVTDKGKQQLGPLLEKHFRKNRGLKKNEALNGTGGLFENKIEANDNFYLTSKGIGFSYAPYEIAPYSTGEVNIFIPFVSMKGLLKPAFKKLIQ